MKNRRREKQVRVLRKNKQITCHLSSERHFPAQTENPACTFILDQKQASVAFVLLCFVLYNESFLRNTEMQMRKEQMEVKSEQSEKLKGRDHQISAHGAAPPHGNSPCQCLPLVVHLSQPFLLYESIPHPALCSYIHLLLRLMLLPLFSLSVQHSFLCNPQCHSFQSSDIPYLSIFFSQNWHFCLYFHAPQKLQLLI